MSSEEKKRTEEGCSSTVFLCWDWLSGWPGLGDLKIHSLNTCPYHFRRVLAVCPIKESKILHLWSYNDLLLWHSTPVLLPGKIPWTEEPGRQQSMGSLRVEHDWATSLWLFTFLHWRRKWQPTPVFLPGESQGWGSLVGCRLWGRTESDVTKVT